MTFTYLWFLLSLHVIIVTSAQVDFPWCYEIQKLSDPTCKGPREWTESCKGAEQSPINIVTGNTVFSKDLKPFIFKGYGEENDFKLTNNGHSAKLSLEGGKEMTISGGGLDSTYKAAELHFHWGSADMFGSEHTINGERYSAELHIVHTKVQSSSRSGGQTSGSSTGGQRIIAVLGFFIEAVKEDNKQYTSIIEALKKIQTKDSIENVPKVVLQQLIPEEKYLKHFYRYNGSLTTYPCNETVTWTVFYETIKLGTSQLEAFTKLNYTQQMFMVENFRPVQKLGKRTVYTSGVEAVLSQSRNVLLSVIVAYIVSTS